MDQDSETLTFLLSDIEKSTRRWERDDAAMAAALERHDDILRTSFEAHGGRWVKHTGDGALVVFPSAVGAVTAAVEVQREIDDGDWTAVGGLRARVAIHTGEATSRDGDYFGQAVNRAARLLDVAHGGQILTSLATEELVRDLLPTGVALRDLGTHALADISRPERVFQVDADGLDSSFPPLRTGADVPSVLPSFRTSFVGREDDLPALAAALETNRLLTLTGAGGSGKTRLAVELAHGLIDRFPDGVYFVDLASITDESLVARQTAAAVAANSGGIVGSSTEPVRQQLRRAIEGKRMLIVLDNCEHVLDASAGHAEELLAASAEIRVLATSREVLALEGEQAWPVTSLALPRFDEEDAAAMRLLLDRVRELRPDFQARDGDRRHLVEICRRLDGLPLALELAAARLAHLSPADVASRLGDRFRLLSGGRRRTERQQTLRATIDWSYDLLDEDERAVLRRLSVFAGGAPLAAVEAVATRGLEDADTIDLLGRLVARSLVVADTDGPATRYRLLETIRLYGEDKLVEAGEAEEVRSRHRDWYLDWLESLPWDLRLVSPAVARQIQTEYDNVRLALEWSAVQGRSDLIARLCMTLAGFGILNGYAEELDRWMTVARTVDLAPELVATLDAYGALIDTWRYDGDATTFDRVRTVADRAYDALPEGDPVRALARYVRATTYSTYPKEPWRMEETASETAQLAAAVSAPWLEIAAMSLQAQGRLYSGDPGGALAILREATTKPAWAPEHDGHNLRHVVAVTLHLLGEHEEALDYALAIADDGAVTWRHVGLMDAALITAARGDTASARDHLRVMFERLEQNRWQHPMVLTDCTIILGAIATYEGRWEDASRLLAISRAETSHPTIFAIWRHHRDQVRATLPRDVRHRLIEEGRCLDAMDAIRQELARR